MVYPLVSVMPQFFLGFLTGKLNQSSYPKKPNTTVTRTDANSEGISKTLVPNTKMWRLSKLMVFVH